MIVLWIGLGIVVALIVGVLGLLLLLALGTQAQMSRNDNEKRK